VKKITVVIPGWEEGIGIPKNYDVVIDVTSIEFIAPGDFTGRPTYIVGMKSGKQFYVTEPIPELIALLGIECT
jgi:hypothetical protein